MATTTDVPVLVSGRLETDRTSRRLVHLVLVAAAAFVLLGVVVRPERTWPSLLLAALYVVGLALGGVLFLAFHYLTSAGWSVCLKRIAEAIAATLPLGAVLILCCFLGIGVLYEWSHADVVAADPILQGKAAWLNVSFFVARGVVYLAIWLLLSRALLRVSREQDRTGGLAANRKSTVLSAVFVGTFTITFSLATFDWLMSLEPHWFSTIFAVYNFTGSFVSALALIAILAIVLRRRGPLAGIVNEHHLHDLGKLILGFTSFWAYIWFSQFMLIWYGNLPEEVTFYQHRHVEAWAVLSVANLLVNWAIPFFVLLPRSVKHNESWLLRMAGLLLVGRWLDLYVLVQPAFEPQAPVLGVWELAPVLLAAGLFWLVLQRALGAADLVPRGDPYLAESLAHHQ